MKNGEKRKQELLKIAYDMFLSRGYEDTSVDDMIEAAQIAKGTYYYYFSSKEQMLGGSYRDDDRKRDGNGEADPGI